MLVIWLTWLCYFGVYFLFVVDVYEDRLNYLPLPDIKPAMPRFYADNVCRSQLFVATFLAGFELAFHALYSLHGGPPVGMRGISGPTARRLCVDRRNPIADMPQSPCCKKLFETTVLLCSYLLNTRLLPPGVWCIKRSLPYWRFLTGYIYHIFLIFLEFSLSSLIFNPSAF